MLNEYFDPLYFFIALGVGMMVVYVSSPVPDVVFKYPTPVNSEKVIYQDSSENCYKYKAEEVKCPAKEAEINVVPIQHVNIEEKEKESIILQFQKMINEKKGNNIIIPHN